MTNAPDSAVPATEILLFEGFDDIDGVVPIEILTAAGFPVRVVGFPPGAGAVTSAHGLRIEVAADIGDAPDLVVIPGGGWGDGAAVGRAGAGRDRVAGAAGRAACTRDGAGLGVHGGDGAGGGRSAHRPAGGHAPQSRCEDLAGAGAEVQADARVVDDGSVVTSGGPAAGIDLALRLVERFHGAGGGRARAR